jgi:magnesium transporter
MINYYVTRNGKIETVMAPEDGCWISMICPTESELAPIAERYGIEIESLAPRWISTSVPVLRRTTHIQ